jgi:hypothetical protein
MFFPQTGLSTTKQVDAKANAAGNAALGRTSYGYDVLDQLRPPAPARCHPSAQQMRPDAEGSNG